MEKGFGTERSVSPWWLVAAVGLLVSVLVLQVVVLVRLNRQDARFREAVAAIRDTATRAGIADASDAIEPRDPFPVGGWALPRPVPNRTASEVLDEMDALFDGAMREFDALSRAVGLDREWLARQAAPAMDMRDDGENYVVVFSVPGLHPRHLHVTLDGRLLTVSAESEWPDGLSGARPQVVRRVLMPGPVGDVVSARAVLTNGLLRVSVPRSRHAAVPVRAIRLM
jgi:HSP20 family molecular chaperone IbpA